MNTDEKRYTDADVQLVAATFIAEAKKNPVDRSTPPWLGVQTRTLLGPTEHDIARAVLGALAAAGRLPATHHLPLLRLTEQETEALILAARAYTHISKGPTLAVLRSALDKLTPTEESA